MNTKTLEEWCELACGSCGKAIGSPPFMVGGDAIPAHLSCHAKAQDQLTHQDGQKDAIRTTSTESHCDPPDNAATFAPFRAATSYKLWADFMSSPEAPPLSYG